MFDGLYAYERILAVLGIVIFAVMSGVVIVYVVQKQTLTTLLPFYALPVIMIGFPAIQKISYENGILVLEMSKDMNPDDEKGRAKLSKALQQVARRPTSDPEANLAMARAYAVLGQPKRALEKVDFALQVNPSLTEALRLRDTLQTEVRQRVRLRR